MKRRKEKGGAASFFLAACLFAFLVPSCSGSGSPTSPTADQLSGTWNVESIQVGSQPVQSKPANASYTLTFGNGQVSTRVDCNTCNGPFALSAETLTVGPAMACTRAACPTMAFGDAYVSVLSGQSTATLSNGTLVLSSARGVVQLVR